MARLTLPVLILASFALMLLGKADALLAERARMALADGLIPIYSVLAGPMGRVHDAITEVAETYGTCGRKMPACAMKTSGCDAGSPSLLPWMPKTRD